MDGHIYMGCEPNAEIRMSVGLPTIEAEWLGDFRHQKSHYLHHIIGD